ncbi:hypothetical protein HK104_001097 [Borealophlyctis nickersoniae]|nr:hypothetical protein HK104_001097 [Borealophlyctis nickersoniae]
MHSKLVSLLLAGAALLAPADAVPAGIAVLAPSSGTNVTGTVVFSKEDGDEMITVDVAVYNLAPNSTHGFHIHNWGDVSDKAALATGAHFNPFNTTHGCDNTTVKHTGDMGNLVADANGTVITKKMLNASVIPGEVNSIFGRAVVVHEKEDDCNTTTPTGNSGARYAQGAIGFATNYTANPVNSSTPAIAPATYPSVAGVAVLTNISGSQIAGNAFFTDLADGQVEIHLFLAGFQPNATHAMHIHTFGNMSSVDGTATVGHFNPLNKTHGCNGTERHAGDLGNIQADGKGRVHATIRTPLISLNPSSNLSVIGRALMVHELQDDCGPGSPTGNAGKRFAQGVIGHANLTLVSANINASEQDFNGTGTGPGNGAAGSVKVGVAVVAAGLVGAFLGFL